MGKLNVCIFFPFFSCFFFFLFIYLSILSGAIDSVQCVCARMVAIPHIEIFVTFDFEPSLISRLTPVWTESNEFSGLTGG